ncbi:hypothetical protein ACIG56_14265 [Nocardia fusca]|uniref:hypothetical protein n=1 Tax=Nocardia fusca TaxID=941183 RepID=UPI0037C77D4D
MFVGPLLRSVLSLVDFRVVVGAAAVLFAVLTVAQANWGAGRHGDPRLDRGSRHCRTSLDGLDHLP